jgi:hypothetical protein
MGCVLPLDLPPGRRDGTRRMVNEALDTHAIPRDLENLLR